MSTYTLTESRLIDLDGLDTRPLEVNNLITESKRKLLALELTGDVGTRERPVEDSHGAGKHTLHGATGEALRVAAPADSHGVGAADVRDNNGRANVAA